ncbi:signal peptide peptidase SppA [Archaeoglobales archaeon]|nr:MAG: signal peptide peptidase SppA [Archaeoglobales archaeon]
MNAKQIILLEIFLILGIVVGATITYFFLSKEKPLFEEEISIVNIEGEILSGYGNQASSTKIAGKIRELADDGNVKAIVLRINSPGGTPAAAQEIVEAVEYAKRKKPVIASLGDLATSGAYYIALPCNRILAEPDTLTGSIGVIWVVEIKVKKYEEEGIDYFIVKSGKMKDMGASWKNVSVEEKEIMQEIVNKSFHRFLNEVKIQRNLSDEQINQIKDGKVILGSDALNLSLIDEIGGLNKAIEVAKNMSKVKTAKERLYLPTEEGYKAVNYLESSPYGYILWSSRPIKVFD